MLRATWAVKRAHWKSWAVMWKALRKKDAMTPARFDLLYALSTHGGAMLQKALREMLGVVRSTISEALAKLEKMGLVKRGVRRRHVGRLVTLTFAGKDALSSAEGPHFELEFEYYVAVRQPLVMLDRLCWRFRRGFGDDAWRGLYDELEYVD